MKKSIIAVAVMMMAGSAMACQNCNTQTSGSASAGASTVNVVGASSVAYGNGASISGAYETTSSLAHANVQPVQGGVASTAGAAVTADGGAFNASIGNATGGAVAIGGGVGYAAINGSVKDCDASAGYKAIGGVKAGNVEIAGRNDFQIGGAGASLGLSGVAIINRGTAFASDTKVVNTNAYQFGNGFGISGAESGAIGGNYANSSDSLKQQPSKPRRH